MNTNEIIAFICIVTVIVGVIVTLYRDVMMLRQKVEALEYATVSMLELISDTSKKLTEYAHKYREELENKKE